MMKHQARNYPRSPMSGRVHLAPSPRLTNRRRSKEATEILREKIQNANEACQSGEYQKAVDLFTEIISLEDNNPIVYCNRSAAYIRMNEWEAALNDGIRTVRLDPDWYKGYYRQAIALQCMGRYAESLAAYASALAHDGSSQQLLQALVEAALKSPLQGALHKLFEQIDQMEIQGKAFATVALIGQELLSIEETQAAITIMESALDLGTENLAIKGSVYSALSNAYWGMGNMKKAIHYMHQDLLTVDTLQDKEGICRVQGNLGNAYFTQASFTEAKQHYDIQYEIASEIDDQKQAAQSLSDLGHLYAATKEYEQALWSHKKAALVYKDINEKLYEGRELSNVGTIFSILGQYDEAIQLQKEYLNIASELGEDIDVCKALSCLGNLYHTKHEYQEAAASYKEMGEIGQNIFNLDVQCKALSGLGHAYRMINNLEGAIQCHEQQLKISFITKDRQMESSAQANLGITYQHKGNYDKALQYHSSYLTLCRKLNDKEGEARAYGNLGTTYNSLGQFHKAIKYHKLGLTIARDLNDRHTEATFHGNMALSYQALNMLAAALDHYKDHLLLSRELNDLRLECIAECNLGNFYCSQNNFQDSLSHFENYLSLTDTLQDNIEKCQATQKLAYSLYKTKQYSESITYYERNISLANELDDTELLALTYCNLGLAYLEINEFEKSIRCQKLFLACAREKKNYFNICKALGNIGDTYIKMGEVEEGLQYYYDQIHNVEKSSSIKLKAECYHEFGNVLKKQKQYNTAILKYEKEASLRFELINEDASAYYDSLFSLAEVHEICENFNKAYKSYCEIFNVSKSNKDIDICYKVSGLMGQIHIKIEKYEKGLLAFRFQLECFDEVQTEAIDLGVIHDNISECYLNLQQHKSVIEHLKIYEKIAIENNETQHQNRACKKISLVYRDMNLLSESLLYNEKRLGLIGDLENYQKLQIYRDVADAHLLLGNHGRSLSYFKQLLSLAKDLQKCDFEYYALSGMAKINEAVKQYENSLELYLQALKWTDHLENKEEKCNTYLNIGTIYQLLNDYDNALSYFQTCLEEADSIKSTALKVQSFAKLGKINHLLLKSSDSCHYLDLSLKFSTYLKRKSESIKASCRYGLKLYFEKSYEHALDVFEKMNDIISQNESTISSKDLIPYIIASYQFQQKILVTLKRPIEALYIASKIRKYKNSCLYSKLHSSIDILPDTDFELFNEKIKSVDTVMFYYSVVIGYLFCWIILPKYGFVKFWKQKIAEKYTDNNLASSDLDYVIEKSLKEVDNKIDFMVQEIRKTVGIKEQEAFLKELQSRKMENDEINDKISFQVSRSKHLPSESLPEFYNIFMKMNIDFLNSCNDEAEYELVTNNLTFIIPREFSLVSLTMLKSNLQADILCSQYKISNQTSLMQYISQKKRSSLVDCSIVQDDDLFVFCNESKYYEEIFDVSRLLNTTAIFGCNTSKEKIKDRILKSKICHLAVDVAWRSGSLVFVTQDIDREIKNIHPSDSVEVKYYHSPIEKKVSVSESESCFTLNEIMKFSFNCKLLTIGIGPTSTHSDLICSDGLQVLVNTFLLKGCQSVLTCLWPVAEKPRRYFLKMFYRKYMSGSTARKAFNETITMMASSQEYGHPSNWSGFVLYGGDNKIERSTKTFNDGLMEFFENPHRETLKIILHLVEKAINRIQQSTTNSLYIAESSIIKKIPTELNVKWRLLLLSVGFRFENAHNDLPDSVFFPDAEYKEQLFSASTTLFSMLGLNQTSLAALAKLTIYPAIGKPLASLLEEVLYYFNQDMSNAQVSLPLHLWKTEGCHEFLSSIGFDVMGIGKTDVKLRSGKLNSRKTLQCALRVVKDIFKRESMNQQKTKRRQRQSNIIIRNEKKVHSILKRAKSENHINVPRYDELNIQNKEGISSKNKNDYLNSELGLFGSKEATALDSDLSDIPRRPRSFTQTENYYQDHPSLNSFSDYDALRKLPHYGTMDKLDTSGLISHELNLDSKSNDQGDERPLSPDCIHEEDIKNFAAYFRQDSKSTTSSGSYSDEISSKCSGASWVDTVDGLRNNVRRDRGFSANDVFAVKHKIIVEDERRKRSPTLMDVEPPSPVLEKKKSNLKNDLFDIERKIRTVSIRDSLNLDISSHSSKLENKLENYSDSPNSERKFESSRNSLESSTDSYERKKKGLLGKIFNKKKHASTDNLLDLHESSDKTKHTNRLIKTPEFGRRLFVK